MRIPVKSEGDAFRWAIGGAAVIFAAVAVGAIAGVAYGLVLLGGALLGALVWEFSDDPDRVWPLRDAASAARREPGRHRVLVIANETVGGEELRQALLQRAGSTPEVRVVCPILPSRAHYIASDIDGELAEAHERLTRTLAWAHDQGIAATGRVSEDTPLVAAADELRDFAADEVIVSTHPASRSRWLEAGLVERLQAELEIPVHHVVVELDRAMTRV